MKGEKASLFMFVGILALLYGMGNYVRVTYLHSWPPYATWMVGGIILIVIGWIKKYWLGHKE